MARKRYSPKANESTVRMSVIQLKGKSHAECTCKCLGRLGRKER